MLKVNANYIYSQFHQLNMLVGPVNCSYIFIKSDDQTVFLFQMPGNYDLPVPNCVQFSSVRLASLRLAFYFRYVNRSYTCKCD